MAKPDHSYPQVPASITDNAVPQDSVKDAREPLSLVDFIKETSSLVSHSEITSFYDVYLKRWNKKIRNKTQDSNELIISSS